MLMTQPKRDLRFTLVYEKINQKYNLKSVYLVQKEKILNDKFYGTWYYHF